MRNNIKELLEKLSKGEKPFYEQDSLPKDMQDKCRALLQEDTDLQSLNVFFEEEIAPIIFHSHNMYRAHR